MARLKKNSQSYDSREDSLLIENARIWRIGRIEKASILIQKGKIRKIARRIAVPVEQRVRAEGLLAFPGLVDVHVHLRDMGLAYKEDFTTGTSAAAAGGFTTVLDMPNTKPPTDSSNRLEEKMRRSSKKILVNVGFHVAAVEDERTITAMADSGAFSLKLYMPRPISPIDVGSDECLLRIMEFAASNNLPVTVHAEDEATLAEKQSSRVRSYADLMKTRPPLAEMRAISRVLRLKRQSVAHVHFCHLTLSNGVRSVKKSNVQGITTEVTPHHLLLSERSLSKNSWKAWMVPPLRSEHERRALLALVANGSVSLVASDHAPHTIKEKSDLPSNSPPGIPGLETTLPLLLTMVNRRRMALFRVIRLLSEAPARIFGLISKGELSEGKDGDVVLVDLKKKSRINTDNFLSKARFSPFEGTETIGVVNTTIVNGRIIYREGQIVAKPGTGRVLRRR